MKRSFAIVGICLAVVLSFSPAVFAGGIGINSTVTYTKNNETLTGRIAANTLEKDPLTVFTVDNNTLKPMLRDIKKIRNTGERQRLKTSWASAESSYPIYEFETTDGKVFRGAIYQWPIFNIETTTKGMQYNVWLDKLQQIEVATVSSSASPAPAAAPAPAAVRSGIRIGARVKYVRKGETFTGIIAVNNLETEPLTIITPAGKSLKPMLKDIRRIRATGEKKKITPPWSYTESTYPIYEFETIDGMLVQGGVYKWPVFDIDNGTLGMDRNVWLEHLTLIETIE
jgi:hypothetical protein